MGKYLTNFKTKEEYNSFKDSSNYIYPNISYIEDSGSVINKSPQTQEKQVEITENGEITITPDAGFAYLNKVSVKTNVAQSGGGSEGGSAMEYLDVRGLGVQEKIMSLMVAYMMNVESEVLGGKGVIPISTAFAGGMDYSGILGDIKYLSINPNDVIDLSGKKMSIKDFITSQTTDDTFLDSIPHITEEEFYNLNA